MLYCFFIENTRELTKHMKLRTYSILLLFVFSVLLGGNTALAAPQPYNLIANPTFESGVATGNPLHWLRGGYGANTPQHAVVTCLFYSASQLPYSVDDVRFGYAFRPICPPDTRYALSVSVGDYRDGDAKWYFTDVPIVKHRKFTLSYQFQAYNNRSRAIARYTFAPGVYRYEILGNMVPPQPGGQGYIAWKNASHEFKAPKGATSLTVFFAVGPDGACDTPCTTTDRGSALSIANVVLKQ